MNKLVEDMRKFHALIGAPDLEKPGIPTRERIELRRKLQREECTRELDCDLRDAYISLDRDDSEEAKKVILERVADSIIDTLVVTVGCAREFGMGDKLEALWDEVWKSNMSKGDGPVREDGKRLKGPNYKPPNIRKVLFGDK